MHHILPVSHTHGNHVSVRVPTPRTPEPVTVATESVPDMTLPVTTQSTLDITPNGFHLLRLDYTNNSAQIVDAAGDCVAIYSGLGGRDAATARVAEDGWHLAPGGEWRVTTPPDGREHPITHQEK